MTVPFNAETNKVTVSDQSVANFDIDYYNANKSIINETYIDNPIIAQNIERRLTRGNDRKTQEKNSDYVEKSKEVRHDARIKEMAYKDLSKLVDLEQLDICIQNDLTRNCISSVFPKVPIKKLAEKFKLVFDTDEIPLTAGEKNKLKECFKSGLSLELFFSDLPLRNTEYIRQKYMEIVIAGTRKTKFKNSFEQLLYEAQWTIMERLPEKRMKRSITNAIGSTNQENIKNISKRSVTRNRSTKDGSALQKGKSKKILVKNKLKSKPTSQEKKEYIEMVNKKIVKYRKSLMRQSYTRNEYNQIVDDNREFTGNGTKRRRTQANHSSKAINDNRLLVGKKSSHIKLEQNSIGGKNIKRKITQLSKKTQKGSKKDTNISKTIKEESNENEDDVNPFDPISILNDSTVSLTNRKFFIPEFYQENPKVPNLKFVEDDSVTTKDDKRFALNDFSAAQIVSDHFKNYRDLPISFPPLLINDPNLGSKIINPNNRVKIRFLMYPQYTEEFVLAQPKSNELNPIYEIQKLFQIHYALYFSHSKKIKKIFIDDYCNALDESVENNSFSTFMFTIDKWNQLMLELSPNNVDECKLDINQEIRIYLFGEEYNPPNAEDLSLDLFFYENMRDKLSNNRILEAPSPQYDIVEKRIPDQSSLTPPCSSEEDEKVNNFLASKKYKLEEPRNIKVISDKSQFRKPQRYIKDFFLNLSQATKMSRFCLHQIFLRVYSRIVSTDSKKLREYKAFTAEVYGELLPSFTSEVLTKVNLLPNQRFYDLGSGVGNTTFQAALEFGATTSGGCELMPHASKLSLLQERLLQKHLALFGIGKMNLNFSLNQSFVDNEIVKQRVGECDVLIVNNYLFDANLNNNVGRLLNDLKPGTKIISLRNFISPRYKACGLNTVFDRLKVEKHEMSHFFSVSWTGNKVPYYISTVQENICPEYL